MNLKEGVIYRSTGSWYTVKLLDGEFVDSRIKGKFRTKGIRTTNPVAVGDKVMIDIEEEGKGVIHEIVPRKNYMIRKSVNLSKEAHVIAANMDLCVLITTMVNPVTSTGFIDRFTVTAQAYDIPLLIVFNKIDLYSKADLQKLEELMKAYENAGCTCMQTSGIKGFGLIDLEKEELANFFPEMFSLLKDCKFHNCKHINEPGCAVVKAVESGLIPEFRYLSYLAMYHEDGEESYRSTNY